MSINSFTLTPQSVRAHMFPAWSDFSAMSSPSESIVQEMIQEEAAELTGKLYAEGISTGAIIDPTSAAWLWSLKTLRLMVALRVLQATTMQDPTLATTYKSQLTSRLDALNENGASELADDGLAPGHPPDGPTTHINVFGLRTDDALRMSSTGPLLRKDDKL